LAATFACDLEALAPELATHGGGSNGALALLVKAMQLTAGQVLEQNHLKAVVWM
jgi:hypothetical protein